MARTSAGGPGAAFGRGALTAEAELGGDRRVGDCPGGAQRQGQGAEREG